MSQKVNAVKKKKKKSFTTSSVWGKLRVLQDVRSSVTVGSRLGFNVCRVAVRARRGDTESALTFSVSAGSTGPAPLTFALVQGRPDEHQRNAHPALCLVCLTVCPPGGSTPPGISAPTVTSIPSPISVNGFTGMPPPQANGQPPAEAVFTNGIHHYPGKSAACTITTRHFPVAAQGTVAIYIFIYIAYCKCDLQKARKSLKHSSFPACPLVTSHCCALMSQLFLIGWSRGMLGSDTAGLALWVA